jgi:hypothetical protein
MSGVTARVVLEICGVAAPCPGFARPGSVVFVFGVSSAAVEFILRGE